MGDSSVFDWSTTPLSNSTVAGVNIAEFAAAAGMNNMGRAIMAGVKGALLGVAAGGTANAITITQAPVPGAYVTGMSIWFIASATNTGATTANLNAIGNKNVFVQGAAGPAACVGGEIINGNAYCLYYDGTQLQLLNPSTLYNSKQGYLFQLTLSNDVGTPNTVLDIAAGQCADSTNATVVSLGAFTKSTGGVWAAGSGGNGMGSGLTIANSTWYHVFAIINAGAADVYFDTSVTAANKPAGTTAFRRIGSVKTDGSAHILAFTQRGDHFRWSSPVTDISGVSNGVTTAVTRGLPSMPLGLALRGDLSVQFVSGVGAQSGVLISSLSETDTACTSVVNSAWVTPGATIGSAYPLTSVYVDTSQNLRTRQNVADTAAFSVITMGWFDTRGK